MSESRPTPIELLAPARDVATAIAAIDHGADAVYMGAGAFGARSAAGNSIDDIRQVVDYAHQFGVRVYATVNTIIFDSELDAVRDLSWQLYRAGVDALIVQDLALTRMEGMPPIALHASTQCDTRTPAKARFLEQCGFTRLVLARELSLEEIKAIWRVVRTDLEVFVHGALCVSYSGDCQASYMLTGRSANRGNCCQVCRFKFDLEDADGRKLIRDKHLLSLRDMNRLEDLESLLEAGASSLKIEGRLKDPAYVKNVVAAYRRELDRIIAKASDKYCRSSQGKSDILFEPDPSLSFNRGFTNYFLRSTQPRNGSLATFGSPKWIGMKVGEVVSARGRKITARLDAELHNGDGLGYFSPSGEFNGFRLNKIEKTPRGLYTLFTTQDIDASAGAQLFRNADKERNEMLERPTASRKINVRISLDWRGEMLCMAIVDESGLRVEVAEKVEQSPARTPQLDRRSRELSKLGDTIYNCVELTDRCGETFIPASTLATLRRRAIEMLNVARKVAYRRERPGHPAAEIRLPEGAPLSRHDNIANSVARKFYAEISGVPESSIPMATECHGADRETHPRVMQSRYCLRRELGACLKTPEGKKYPSPLFLTSGGNRFLLDFDCANCRMNLLLQPRK